MGEALLDPYSMDDLADLQRRVLALETQPKVVPPVAMRFGSYNASPGADWYGQFTNAAFGANGWSAVVPRIPKPAVYVVMNWRTGAGTTGEVQLTAKGGTLTTPARSLAAASSGTMTWLWYHNGPLWTTPYNFDLGVRRTGGANVVEVQVPIGFFVDAAGATLTGV